MLKILNHYKVWYIVSALLMAGSLAAIFGYGLNLGIDFKGGTLTQVTFLEAQPTAVEVKSVLSENGAPEALIQPSDGAMLIRTAPQDKDEHDALLAALSARYGEVREDQFTSVGPVIGRELTNKAVWQLLLVGGAIILYIAYAFRKVTRPVSAWRFGWAAILALLHDLVLVVGVFALLGRFYQVEIDSLFVTALLTVLGFSVHDTIVVFDRIRENLRVRAGESLSEIINASITQTIVRSINTSLTVVIVLTALLLFGGESIRYFVLALLVGVVAGTYSSIFIASPVLISWHNRDLKKRGA